MKMAYNKDTNEYIGLYDDGWKPIKVAQNANGEKIYLGSEGWEAFSDTDNEQTSPSWGEVAKGAKNNFLPSAKRAAGEVVSAITSPIETAKAIGNVGLGTVQKIIPGEQESEKYADAVGQYFVDRYGSMDGFKHSIMLDPAGVLADLSSIFTGGGALVKAGAKVANVAKAGKTADVMNKLGKTASTIGNLTDPVNLAMKGMGMGVNKLHNIVTGKDIADGLYHSALKPQKGEDLTRLAKTGLNERITPTARGYEKAENIVDNLNSQIQSEIDKVTTQGITIDPKEIANKAFEDSYNHFYKQVASTGDLNIVSDTVDDFLTNHGKGFLSPAFAQELKQGTYRILKDKAYKGDSNTPRVETEKALARELKHSIAEKVPSVSALNARESDLLNLMKQVERATGRTNNWNIFSLPSMVAGAGTVGTLGAGPAAILATMVNAGRSPYIKSNLAFALNEGAIPKIVHNIGAGGYAGGSFKELNDRINKKY